MKTSTISLIMIVAALSIAAGYLLGRQEQAADHGASAQAGPKILYYRNPMGLPDTSPVPKKDDMGMDYVPVYEGDETGGASVALSPERIQLLGVTTEAVQMRKLGRTVRASAVIQPSERNLHLIAPRFSGWVQQLHVNATGQRVLRGQALLTVYSPDLESAVREYQLAKESGLADVARSTRQRLQNWEISEQDMAHLEHGQTQLVLRSPISGVVLEKPATAGARFAAGDVLFKLASLSVVWVQADVAEQDQGVLRVGQHASVTLDTYPGRVFHGKVSFISPVLDPQTRTVQVRVELTNAGGNLRPGMYARVELDSVPDAAPLLSIPQSAVIDSGMRQIALVQVGPGRFAPRDVKLGQRAGDYVEVLEGLVEGEQVVTRANFLLDAESNLKSALGSAQHAHGNAAPVAQPTTPGQRPQSEPAAGKGETAPAKVEHHHAE